MTEQERNASMDRALDRMHAAAHPDVFQINGVGYGVASKSKPGYFVLVEGASCSCPAAAARSCRHRKAVAEWVAERSRQYARPSVKPNVSAMCD